MEREFIVISPTGKKAGKARKIEENYIKTKFRVDTIIIALNIFAFPAFLPDVS